MGATRLASGKYAVIINSSSVRILTPISIPTRDASPPLELAFGGSAWLWRLVLEETQALMGATRLASGKYAAIINSSSARI